MLEANDNRHSRLARSLNGEERRLQHRGERAVQYGGRPVDPVFLAFYPDALARQSIARLAFYVRDKHRLEGLPLGQHRSHITICGFCEFADLTDAMITAIGDAVMSIGMPPFRVGLDYVEKFLGGAVVLRGDDGLAGVSMFQDHLMRALPLHGFDEHARPYNPHLTLLYDPGPVPMQAVEEIRWTVRECVLVHSPRGKGRHIPIARWPLSMRLAAANPAPAMARIAAPL